MLYLSNSRIFFNFEVGNYHRYSSTSIPFCKEEDASELIPHVRKFESFDSTMLIDHLNILLYPNEMYKFIKDWKDKSWETNKLFEWNIDDWIKDYIQCYHEINEISNGDYNFDIGHFKYLKYNETKKLDFTKLKSVKPVININEYKIYPEFSWAFEDVLYHMKHGTSSPHEDFVNSVIEYNINITKDAINIINNFSNDIINFEIPNSIKIKDLDLSNKNIFSIIYSPFDKELIRTNYIHLKKCINKYNEEV